MCWRGPGGVGAQHSCCPSRIPWCDGIANGSAVAGRGVRPRFQLPPPRTQHADRPRYALLHHFAASDGAVRWRGPRSGQWADSVRIEQSERAILPRVAPPLPTKTVTLARARQLVFFSTQSRMYRSTGSNGRPQSRPSCIRRAHSSSASSCAWCVLAERYSVYMNGLSRILVSGMSGFMPCFHNSAPSFPCRKATVCSSFVRTPAGFAPYTRRSPATYPSQRN